MHIFLQFDQKRDTKTFFEGNFAFVGYTILF